MWLPSSVHKYCESPCDGSSTPYAGRNTRAAARGVELCVVGFVGLTTCPLSRHLISKYAVQVCVGINAEYLTDKLQTIE